MFLLKLLCSHCDQSVTASGMDTQVITSIITTDQNENLTCHSNRRFLVACANCGKKTNSIFLNFN